MRQFRNLNFNTSNRPERRPGGRNNHDILAGRDNNTEQRTEKTSEPGEIILFKVIANICTTLEPYKAEICLKHSKTNIEPQPALTAGCLPNPCAQSV